MSEPAGAGRPDSPTPGARFEAPMLRPRSLINADLSALPQLHRQLLITDGSVTTILMAHYLEEVNVREWPRDVAQPSVEQLASLEATELPVLSRAVSLVGAASGVTYASASSVVVPSRLPPAVAARIGGHPKGLGGAMRDGELPVFRRLLWWGGVPSLSDELGGCLRAVERAYLMLTSEGPFALVRERFPLPERDS